VISEPDVNYFAEQGEVKYTNHDFVYDLEIKKDPYG